MNLKDLQDGWKDEKWYHQRIHERFCEYVNNDETLSRHRTWVEQMVFGFGERSFHYLWLLLVNELPNEFKFLEIGVFRGQTLSLVALIAKYTCKTSHITGVSPLDNTDGHWDSDYVADVAQIHDEFEVSQPKIIKGLSTDPEIINQTKTGAPYDLIYIDGGHTSEVVTSDLQHYPEMVKKGGYLVIDDCNNEMNMPFGFFQGIAPVTDAKIAWLKGNKDFEFVCSVVHISVFRRI